VSSAPALVDELAQPWPALPLLAQGQGRGCVPSPKQKGVPSVPPPAAL
jgi:hypothetical protein